MTKKINNFESFNNKTILLLTKEEGLHKTVELNLSSFEGKIHCSNKIDSSILDDVDLLLIDIDYFDIVYLNDSVFNSKLRELNIPVIYLATNVSHTIINNIENVPLKNIIMKNEQLKLLSIYVSLTLKKNSRVYFNHDYSFCLSKKSFFFKDNEIALTNLELRLLYFLTKHKNRLVEYDKIIEYVWEGKACSVFSMRNIVSKIREKSYYQIIKNNSNKGYLVNDFKIY